MRASAASFDTRTVNPLDVVEDLILSQDWEFERRGQEELVVEVPGRWCDFALFLAWTPQMNALHVSCALDLRANRTKSETIYELLAKVNERLWIGHFSLWTEEGVPIFKHSILVERGERISPDKMASLMEIAIEECERFYPAFQYVIWGGKTANEAIDAAMIETVGEA